jgi:Alpha/beta hydrolase family
MAPTDGNTTHANFRNVKPSNVKPNNVKPNNVKPTIIFVQGSFQIPLVYSKLVKGLQSNGYSVVSPALPSCTGTDAPDFPSRTLVDDAMAVRRELERLIKVESKKVVVVMHSYGGLVGSEAIPEDLSYSRRQSQGQSGGVIHLYYYSAFILPKGQSVMSTFGESPNNDVRVGAAPTISCNHTNTDFCCSRTVATPSATRLKQSIMISPKQRQNHGSLA